MRFFLSLLLALAPLFVWGAQTPAGRVEAVEGDARIYDAANLSRPAKVAETVFEGESIVTGDDGEVHLAMEDDGQIAVRPKSRVRIVKYRAEGGSNDTSIISLVQGALRSVTGWIGKYNPKGYAIRTPTATIGVRGTDHETVVVSSGNKEAEAGTYDKVNEGATVLSSPYGQTEVRRDQAGFVSLSQKSAPRLLASIPAVFRPARFDARFRNLHETVRQRIDARRSQRIESIRERRQKIDAGRNAGHSPVHEQKRQDGRRRFEEQRRQMEQHRPGDRWRDRRTLRGNASGEVGARARSIGGEHGFGGKVRDPAGARRR